MSAARTLLVVFLLMGMMGAAAPLVFALDATSTSYKVGDAALSEFGGNSSSTNFTSVGSGGQQQNGPSTSTSFTLLAGDLYFDTFTPASQNWQWFSDINNETPTVSLAGENVAPSGIDAGTNLKLRISVADIGSTSAAAVKFRVQYSTQSDFSSGVYNAAEIGSCSASDAWCYANGVDADGDIVTTRILSDSDACSGGVGNGCGIHNESGTTTSSHTQVASSTSEYEFTLLQNNAAGGTVYFFRLYYIGGGTAVAPNTGASYPSISTGGNTLSFSISGVTSGTPIDGTNTTIDTTSTSVPFGTLSTDVPQIGAHHLVVTTNASNGYQVYTYAQQNFLGATGSQIPGVLAPNDSPAGWSSSMGCTSTSTGCYGYHTSEGVLSSAPTTRFAANDTFAHFSTTTPDEVAYSGGPATGRSTDVLYKIESHALQAADSYTTGVVYIVVPTF